jgi:hypothetical protein
MRAQISEFQIQILPTTSPEKNIYLDTISILPKVNIYVHSSSQRVQVTFFAKSSYVLMVYLDYLVYVMG